MQPSVLNQPLSHQFSFLLLLGLAVACVSWTITHEEAFREPREFCKNKSQSCEPFYQRKFFYLFTCEYCFSHYVAALFLLLTHLQMLYQGWRGFVISEFALVVESHEVVPAQTCSRGWGIEVETSMRTVEIVVMQP